MKEQPQTGLLSSILDVTVRNEEKISAEDREFCEARQVKLHDTLRRLQEWYDMLTARVEPYRQSRNIVYEANGAIDKHQLKNHYHTDESEDFSAFEFLPVRAINEVVELYGKAVRVFAGGIVRHFNRKYGVSVPMPKIDDYTLPMGFLPTYQPCVDAVIAHLGGKNFREVAEDELIARFHDRVTGYRNVLKAELKGDRIVIPDAVWLDGTYDGRHRIKWDSAQNLSALCAGVIFGTTGSLNGGVNYLAGFDSENVDVTRRYRLIGGEVSVRFFKNRRLDFKLESAAAAEMCWKLLKLHEVCTQ